MDDIDQDIRAQFRYRVQFTRGVFQPENTILRDALPGVTPAKRSEAIVVIDAGVAHHHPKLRIAIEAYFDAHADAMNLVGPVLIVPGGEAVKNDPAHLQTLYEAINDAGICRHSYVITIGGGAVLDIVGYAAATAHRGVRLVRLPTTVLAQNDSGVGVKNSINFFGKKNFLGTFAPPHAVINDLDFLTTLEHRDWMAGTSEAVKVALIRDRAFFDVLRKDAPKLVARDMPAMERLIHRCAELHVRHIGTSGDAFETGSSRPLDFGHWAAHKLEQMTNFELRHGEAVAIGMMLDVSYSGLIGSLPQSDVEAIRDCLASLDLPLHDPAMRDATTLLKGLEEFREHLGGELTITLLRGIGKGYEVHTIDHAVMRKAIDALAGAPVGRPNSTSG